MGRFLFWAVFCLGSVAFAQHDCRIEPWGSKANHLKITLKDQRRYYFVFSRHIDFRDKDLILRWAENPVHAEAEVYQVGNVLMNNRGKIEELNSDLEDIKTLMGSHVSSWQWHVEDYQDKLSSATEALKLKTKLDALPDELKPDPKSEAQLLLLLADKAVFLRDYAKPNIPFLNIAGLEDVSIVQDAMAAHRELQESLKDSQRAFQHAFVLSQESEKKILNAVVEKSSQLVLAMHQADRSDQFDRALTAIKDFIASLPLESKLPVQAQFYGQVKRYCDANIEVKEMDVKRNSFMLSSLLKSRAQFNVVTLGGAHRSVLSLLESACLRS